MRPTVRDLGSFERHIAGEWGRLWARVSPGHLLERGVDRRLYALGLIELFHWSSHAPRLYARAAASSNDRDPAYTRLCLGLAHAELGHAELALGDLAALGLEVPREALPLPLGSTEALIAYVDRVTGDRPPFPVLGYDYWTETPYTHISPWLEALTTRLALPPAATRYLTVHQAVDVEHGAALGRELERLCQGPLSWERVAVVATTTLRLMGLVIEEVVETFERVRAGQDERHELLAPLA